MIDLSPSAVRKIESLVREAGEEPRGLRLFVSSGGCSGLESGMRLDSPQEGDCSIPCGVTSLLVAARSLEKLRGCRIEFDDGLHGRGFEIVNPNAVSTCGCGRSFS